MFGQVGYQVSQVKDQVGQGQGQGQELDNNLFSLDLFLLLLSKSFLAWSVPSKSQMEHLARITTMFLMRSKKDITKFLLTFSKVCRCLFLKSNLKSKTYFHSWAHLNGDILQFRIEKIHIALAITEVISVGFFLIHSFSKLSRSFSIDLATLDPIYFLQASRCLASGSLSLSSLLILSSSVSATILAFMMKGCNPL